MTSEQSAWLLVGGLATALFITIRRLRKKDRHIVLLNGPIPNSEEEGQ
jgi:hypothetical protein